MGDLRCLAFLQDHCPIFRSGENRESVLAAAALAAKWTEPAKDALDTMVLGKFFTTLLAC